MKTSVKAGYVAKYSRFWILIQMLLMSIIVLLLVFRGTTTSRSITIHRKLPVLEKHEAVAGTKDADVGAALSAKLYAEMEARKHQAAITMFYHIHKAAGTTLCNYAKDNFNSTGRYNCNIGRYDEQKAFEELSLNEKKQVLTNGLDVSNAQKYAPRKVDFLAVEYFGVPREDQWFDVSTEPQVVYITCLRNPITRMISQYHYLKTGTKPVLGENTSLEQYLMFIKNQSRITEVHFADNLMVRQLSGTDAIYETPPGEVNAGHLEKAVQNLKKFSVVLIMEALKQRGMDLERVLGWRDIGDLISNKKNARMAADDGSSYYRGIRGESMRLLLELNRWDLILYHEAVKLYDIN